MFHGWGFSGGASDKEPTCQYRRHRDGGLSSGSGRSPEGGHGNPLQYSCLEDPHGQRSLVGYSPQGHRESDTTVQLSTRSISALTREHGLPETSVDEQLNQSRI